MKNRIVLIIVIVFIFIGSYLYMNRNYDRLARYPYSDPEVKEALETKLSSRQLAYIVDYLIAPEYYMPYINSAGFNAYHIDDYNRVEKYFYRTTGDNIVKVTELLLKHTGDYDEFLKANSWRSFDDLCYEIERYYK